MFVNAETKMEMVRGETIVFTGTRSECDAMAVILGKCGVRSFVDYRTSYDLDGGRHVYGEPVYRLANSFEEELRGAACRLREFIQRKSGWGQLRSLAAHIDACVGVRGANSEGRRKNRVSLVLV